MRYGASLNDTHAHAASNVHPANSGGRMIVVEGPDGAGKSTLVREITQQYELMEGTRTTSNRAEIYKTVREDTWRAISTELRCHEKPLVWDRIGPISDPIYCDFAIPVRTCAFSADEIRFFHQTTMHLDWLVILCLPSKKTCMDNIEGTEQMGGVHEKINDIWCCYNRLTMRFPRYSVYAYDVPASKHKLALDLGFYFQSRKERRNYVDGYRQL